MLRKFNNQKENPLKKKILKGVNKILRFMPKLEWKPLKV